MARIDLSNKRFGKLLVIEYSHTTSDGRACWKCMCDCGKTTIVKAKYLLCGDTKSCGCLKQPNPDSYFLETKFGKLQPLEKIITDGVCYFKCICDCGAIVQISKSNLLQKNSTSCGCNKRYTEAELINKKFGWLLVKSIEHGKALCLCDCGKYVKVNCYDLASKNNTSCGCRRRTESILRWKARPYNKEHIIYLRRAISSSNRKKIYARDNFRCQICSRSNFLQMHHIIPVREDASLESIFDPKNCITLCRTCHLQIAHGKTTKDLDKNIQSFLLWQIQQKYK